MNNERYSDKKMVNFTLEQATKAQRGSRGIALFSLFFTEKIPFCLMSYRIKK
jgi:hypothetical protein